MKLERTDKRQQHRCIISADMCLNHIATINDKKNCTFTEQLDVLQQICHGFALKGGWWNDIETGEPKDRNVGELICLMHSELSEAMEGVRKGLMDDKLPHRLMVEVELADTIIRILDFSGAYGLDISGAIYEKLAFNAQRADHKPENRKLDGGKKF